MRRFYRWFTHDLPRGLRRAILVDEIAGADLNAAHRARQAKMWERRAQEKRAYLAAFDAEEKP